MIEAFFEVPPEALAINKAKRCGCRRQKRGRSAVVKPVSYTTDDHAAASAEVSLVAKKAWRSEGLPVFPDGPVIVEIESRPKRQHREGAAAALPCMDDDAPVKAVRDALNEIAYTDDAQVVRTVSSKTTEGPVGIRVRVYRPEEMEQG